MSKRRLADQSPQNNLAGMTRKRRLSGNPGKIARNGMRIGSETVSTSEPRPTPAPVHGGHEGAVQAVGGAH